MKKTKLLAVLGTVCALSVTASVGTAVYAYYVRHQLNQQNTLTIGNAEMFITNEEGTTAAAFSADITPYNGQFAPETYAQAVELARQDNGTHIADAKIIVSREEESRIFYGLSLETDDYANCGLLAQNVYVTCYEADETSAGTLTEWNHVPLADAGYIEGNMGADSTTYHIFVTYENVAGAGTGDVQFDIALNSSPAPVTAEADIGTQPTEVMVDGAEGAATLVAQAWYDGAEQYSVMQGGEELYRGSNTLAEGWQQISIPNVNFAQGRAELSVSGGTLYLKQLRTLALSEITADISDARTLYKQGEQAVADGIILTAHYTDGSTATVDGGFEVAADTSAVGVKQAVINYGGLECSYRIAVVPDVEEDSIINFVNLSDDGASLTLYIAERTGGGSNAENATAQGMYLYRDGAGYQAFNLSFSYVMPGWQSTFESEGISEVINDDFWDENNGALFVELGEVSSADAMRFMTESNVWHTVFMGWNEVARITEVTVPADKTFAAGSMFDGSGITISYVMTDGTEGEIVATAENIADNTIQFYDIATRNDLNAEGATLSAGTLNVRVMYDSKVFDITVEVSEDYVTGIQADAEGAKTSFLHGETFTFDGLEVYEVFASGARRQVAEGFEVSGIADLSAVTGEQRITVTYGGFTAEYAVNVSHNFVSSEYEPAAEGDGTFYRTCVCGEREKVDVWGDRTVTVNGQAFTPYSCYDGQFAQYGIEYDVTKGGGDAEFVITLNAENTAGVYAQGINIVTTNNDVVINVEQGAAKINATVTDGEGFTDTPVTFNLAADAQLGAVEFPQSGNQDIIKGIFALGERARVDSVNMGIFMGADLYLAEGASVGTFTVVNNAQEIIEVSGNATIESLDVNGSGGSTTVRGGGTLTINSFTDQGRGAISIDASVVFNCEATFSGALTINADTTVYGTLSADNVTVGNAENTVQPVLHVIVDGGVNGMQNKSGAVNWKFLSGSVILENKQAANPGISLNDGGDSIFIGENAALITVRFVAAYGAWDGAAGNYRVEVYGAFKAYGANQTPPNAVESTSADDATGTYVAPGAEYIMTGLAAEDWQAEILPEEDEA